MEKPIMTFDATTSWSASARELGHIVAKFETLYTDVVKVLAVDYIQSAISSNFAYFMSDIQHKR